ncbi:phage terminase large subunit [Inquilinus limosus]|uniref:phage terminase large subunit n=1 Tax=Inquilinus limosus TaxID=171674 RepID=UPI0003FDAF62|nr:phage terminase large subunit [Inquilinus limosus]
MAKPASKQTKSADFLAAMAALSAEIRQEIENKVQGFSPDPVAQRERKKRAAVDFDYFCATYFPHYVTSAASGFHTWLYATLPGLIHNPAKTAGAREAIAAPRGNAKTTHGQMFILWCIVHGYKRFPVVMSDASDQAAAILEGIKVELEVNPRLAQDFPDATGPGRVWQVGVIVTRNQVKVQAFGSGKRLRGVRHGAYRPDLCWLDDLENDENVRSPEQRDKLEAWIDKAVEPLGPPDGSMDIIYVGTILHYDAVLARKLRNPLWRATVFRAIVRWPDRMDLWERWEEVLRNDGEPAADAFHAENRELMEAGAEVLWPAVQPFVKLMKIRVRIKVGPFDCEYQNDPVSSDDALFGKVTFWVSRLAHWMMFGACDPSLGKQNRGRDPSALLVGGLNRETGILDVVEARIARRLPDKIIEDVIALQREHRCLVWGVEAVQFQEFFRTELVRRSAERGVPVPAVPIMTKSDKALRIESLQPHVANGLIRFHPSQTVLLDQLRHYPKGDHDDGPDALEMLWVLAIKRMRMTAGIQRAGAPPMPYEQIHNGFAR